MAQHTTAEKSRNTAFFRLSNRHISASLRRFAKAPDVQPYGFSSLGDLALYAMIGTVLSNPAFTYAQGGLQKLLMRHTTNRYFSLHGAIRRLTEAGYLLRTRIPEGKNCFHDYYTLSHTQKEADRTAPRSAAASCLTAAEGRAFRASYRPYLPPTEDYTEVSVPMLMDPALSLGAKGLYIVIARYLRLQTYKPDITLTKDMLRRVCREGSNAFDRLFRELRTSGYLTLERCRSAQSGYPGYRYILHKTPDTETVSACHAQNRPHPAADTQKNAASAAQTASSVNGTVPSPTITVSALRAQIEYDCLIEDYAKERLDCIVSILHSYLSPPKTGAPSEIVLDGTVCKREEIAARFSVLDSEDIRYVLDTYHDVVKKREIRSIRGYLTACLYYAKENLALALDAFAVRAPGTVTV